jgi:hypothetical protein
MNDNQEIPNLILREAATSSAFLLQLSKTHIAALDMLAHDDRSRWPAGMRDLFITGVRGLIERGLVIHAVNPNHKGQRPPHTSSDTLSDYYRLTRAGWLMHDLLAEAGMVDAVTSKKQRRLVA